MTLTCDGRFVAGRIVPLRLEGLGTPVYDPSGASVTLMRTLSDEDFAAPRLRIAATDGDRARRQAIGGIGDLGERPAGPRERLRNQSSRPSETPWPDDSISQPLPR